MSSKHIFKVVNHPVTSVDDLAEILERQLTSSSSCLVGRQDHIETLAGYEGKIATTR